MNPSEAMIHVNSTNESRDSFNDAVAVQQQQQQILSVISYLKFYHFSKDDDNFYLVTCEIVPQEDSSFDEHGRYNHEFFYQHPNNPFTKYYVTCKLLSRSLLENILNDEFCGLEFGLGSLSIHQKLNLEQSLKQKLFYRMHYDRNATFNRNHLMTTQPIPMSNVQNYNNDSINTQHGLYNITTHPQQQMDFNNFSYLY
jgi:hypothetical protein